MRPPRDTIIGWVLLNLNLYVCLLRSSSSFISRLSHPQRVGGRASTIINSSVRSWELPWLAETASQMRDGRELCDACFVSHTKTHRESMESDVAHMAKKKSSKQKVTFLFFFYQQTSFNFSRVIQTGAKKGASFPCTFPCSPFPQPPFPLLQNKREKIGLDIFSRPMLGSNVNKSGPFPPLFSEKKTL